MKNDGGRRRTTRLTIRPLVVSVYGALAVQPPAAETLEAHPMNNHDAARSRAM
jgi:hypothetical protein